MYPRVPLSTVSFSAGVTHRIHLNELPNTLAGAIAYLAALDFELDFQVDSGAGGSIPGRNWWLLVDRIRLKDRFSIPIVDIPGHMLREGMRALVGTLTYADPGDISASQSNQTGTAYATIPFEGYPNGILGFARNDLLHAVERFWGPGQIEISWASAATAVSANVSNLDSATLSVHARLKAINDGRDVIRSGVDLRIRSQDSMTGSQGSQKVSLEGVRQHAIIAQRATANATLSFTSLTVERLSYLTSIAGAALVQGWNYSAASDRAEHEAPDGAYFVPIVHPTKASRLLDAHRFGRGEMKITGAEGSSNSFSYLISEIFDSSALAARLATQSNTLYAGLTEQKPIFEKKNSARVGSGLKGAQLLALLPRKLMAA